MSTTDPTTGHGVDPGVDPALTNALARLASTPVAGDPASHSIADAAIRAGVRTRRIRQGIAGTAACGLIAGVGAFALHQPDHATQYAAPVTPSSTAKAHRIESMADFQTVVKTLVPTTAQDVFEMNPSGPLWDGDNPTWHTSAQLVVMKPGDTSSADWCAKVADAHDSRISCTTSKVAAGTLSVVVERHYGLEQVSEAFLTRSDGVIISLKDTGSGLGTKLTRAMAVKVVTSPLWDVDPAWLVRSGDAASAAANSNPSQTTEPSTDYSASAAAASSYAGAHPTDSVASVAVDEKLDAAAFRAALRTTVPDADATLVEGDGDGSILYMQQSRAWNAEVTVAAYVAGAKALGTCASYAAPFTCTQTTRSEGVLTVVSLTRADGTTIAPFVWLTRPDGVRIVLGLTGPNSDYQKTTLTAAQAVSVVTNSAWDKVVVQR